MLATYIHNQRVAHVNKYIYLGTYVNETTNRKDKNYILENEKTVEFECRSESSIDEVLCAVSTLLRNGDIDN